MKIFLYPNQPLIKYRGKYFVKFKNFIDFFIELSKLNEAYCLVIPCKVMKELPKEKLIQLDLPHDKVIEINYENSKFIKFIKVSFRNVFYIRSRIIFELSRNEKVIFAGSGPDFFLILLLLLLPRAVDFAFFMRGDKLATVRYYYKKSPLYPFIISLIKVFNWRIYHLINQSRAKVFLFGEKLREEYSKFNLASYVIASLIDKSWIRKDKRPVIPEGRPLKVLFVGRLSPEKNIFSLLEACKLSIEKKQPFTLSIIGCGPLEIKIREWIKKFKLSDYIKFMGYIPHGVELIKEYDSHDLLCLPSYTEGIPRTVVEAFAREMPVLATPVGSLPTIFPKEIKFLNGFSAEKIFQGIKWCNNHRMELSLMGIEGQRIIHSFVIQENAVKVDKILREM